MKNRVESTYMRCPSCGGPIEFDPIDNVFVCTRCGFVVEEHAIDHSSEMFYQDRNTARTSGTYTFRMHDHGIGGTEIAGSLKRHLSQGRSWAVRQKDVRVSKDERMVKKALTYVNELAKLLGSPSYVVETAGSLVRNAVAGRKFKERTLYRLAAGAIYLAYHVHGEMRPTKTFVQEVGISLSELWEAVKTIRTSSAPKPLPKRNTVEGVITYAVKKLNLPPETEYLAHKIVAAILETPAASGKSKTSLAVAAVYVAAILTNNRRTQNEVASTVSMSDVAVRNSYSTIVDNLDIVVFV
ncbi:MAG: transcription initiation factor IIB family protein [Desulfurococcaceae archaeon]